MTASRRLLNDLADRMAKLSDSFSMVAVFSPKWDAKLESILDLKFIGSGLVDDEIYAWFFVPHHADVALLEKWKAIAGCIGQQLQQEEDRYIALGKLDAWMRWAAAIVAYRKKRITPAEAKVMLNWQGNGCRYFLIDDVVSQSIVLARVLALIDPADDDERKKDYTESQLEDAIIAVIKTDTKRYWKAVEVANAINARNPSKKVGATKVGDHPVHKAHKKQWGKNRAPRNTSKAAEEACLNKLKNQQRRDIEEDEGTSFGQRIR